LITYGPSLLVLLTGISHGASTGSNASNTNPRPKEHLPDNSCINIAPLKCVGQVWELLGRGLTIKETLR